MQKRKSFVIVKTILNNLSGISIEEIAELKAVDYNEAMQKAQKLYEKWENIRGYIDYDDDYPLTIFNPNSSIYYDVKEGQINENF
jgi:hypothetical protein